MDDFPGVRVEKMVEKGVAYYTLRISSLNVRAAVEEEVRRHIEYETRGIIDNVDVDRYNNMLTDVIARRMIGLIEKVVRTKIKKLLKE